MKDIKVQIVSMPREEYDRLIAALESLHIQLKQTEEKLKALRKKKGLDKDARPNLPGL